MAIQNYVYVSADNTDKTIYDGPFLWDGITPLTPPAGRQSMTLAAALAGGYAFTPASAAQTNLAALQAKAFQALSNNTTYLGISNPTSAQAIAQVGALTRQVDALIRVDMGILDSTAGT